MTLTEQSTMITDYALGVFALGIAFALARVGNTSRAGRVWVGAPLFIGIGAISGGTVHGFRNAIGEPATSVLWTAMLVALGLATFCFSVSAYYAGVGGNWRRRLFSLSGVQLVLYVVWIAGHADFRFAVYNYAPTMLVVLLIHIVLAVRRGSAASRWIIGGIALSFAAAGAQMTGRGFHEHFNHNDVYHVIQMIGLWFFYKGGRLLEDYDKPAERIMK